MASNNFMKLVSSGLVASALVGSMACQKRADSGAPVTTPTATPAPSAPPATPAQPSAGSHSSQDPVVKNNGSAPQSAPPQGHAPVVRYDPSGMTPDELFKSSAAQGPAISGPKSDVVDYSGAPLEYSGSGQDNLREQIENFTHSKNGDPQNNSDREFASRVSDATVDVNWDNRTMAISFDLVRAGKHVRKSYFGAFDNALTSRHGSLKFPGDVAVEAACMDLNGGCNTVYLKIQEASVSSGVRTAHVLVRKTSSTLYTEGNGFGLANNPEYDYLLGILLNTIGHSGEARSVSALELVTSETINGQSSFAIKMMVRTDSLRDQLVGWTGPLVKPAGDDHMDLTIDPIPSQMVVNGRVVEGKGFITNTIRETRLVRNDGRGNLQVAVTVRKNVIKSTEDTLRITFGRIHTPVKQLRLL